MFARAAIVGRVARERTEARRNYLQHKRELKKKVPQASFRQRCFIPLLRGPCITVASGVFLIIIGAIMCNFAFHADHFSQIQIIQQRNNDSQPEESINETKFQALKSLTFIGPSIMGLGIFIIIIACVLLMDKRDHILKEYTDSMLRTQQDMSMELSYCVVTSSGLPGLSSRRTNYKHFNASNKQNPPAAKKLLSQSSLPCIRSCQMAMHDIAEVEGQQVELSTLQPGGSVNLNQVSVKCETENDNVFCDDECHTKKLLPETSQL